MDIVLFHSPGACSMAVYISLIEAGVEFEVKLIRLKNNEQSSLDYATLNPKKKVPYLLVDGKGLSENVAIQSWIAETFPKANLLPTDIWNHKRALSYMSWFGSGVHPHITRHFKTSKFCSVEEAHADIKVKADALYMEQLALIDAELAGRTWFFDHFTACDAYFFWIYDRGMREGFDLSLLEHATLHNQRMHERQSVQKTLSHT